MLEHPIDMRLRQCKDFTRDIAGSTLQEAGEAGLVQQVAAVIAGGAVDPQPHVHAAVQQRPHLHTGLPNMPASVLQCLEAHRASRHDAS